MNIIKRCFSVLKIVRVFSFLVSLEETATSEGSNRAQDMQPAAMAVLLLLLLCAFGASANKSWNKPGCHIVGHTREVTIPGCAKFIVRTNACRGFCESWSMPSHHQASLTPGHRHSRRTRSQQLVSVGQCCNIMDTENVQFQAICLDGLRTVTFKSATSCSCYHCKKE